jgi:lipoprotein-releasing system ATP-binding protein
VGTDTIISAKNLGKSFQKGGLDVNVLRGVDLDIQRGESVAVVGASGVGKSTLLQIMGGLDRPTTGSVLFNGRDVFRLSDPDLATFRNRNVGFVFQFHHLLPDFSAIENAMMPALVGGISETEARLRAKELLNEVGLGSRFDHRPGELSGGEQQRVAIARALMLRPSVILADEPTGNLDTHTAESVHELLMDLNRQNGVTLVIVTHNESLAGMAHRAIRMVDGVIVEG